MDDTIILVFVMATLGQVGLCTTVLLMRTPQRPVYLPLATFFIATGIISTALVVPDLLPALNARYFSITLPAFLLLGPALWFYVDGLTSEKAWRPERRDLWHLIPFGLGIIATALTNALSVEALQKIFINGELVDRFYPTLVVLYIFALILGWTIQSGYYVIRILYRLATYRRRLKMLFASTENSELKWLTWLLFVIGTTWALSFASIIFDNFAGFLIAGPRTGAIMALAIVWSLAVWGLRQKPGFEGRYLDDETDQQDLARSKADGGEKYSRSALSPEQAERIATKLETAMKQDQIYLDPTISLPALARHIGAPTNHVSRTLNETIGECFFDYINKWRIYAAKPLIASGTKTILDIAMTVGFNARSSFYKAFKRETGQTPSEYRKAFLKS